ncbi:MAG: chorismate mutase [Clostridia bacterium]|nr:chorismate mutase [Clostridia bacterium]
MDLAKIREEIDKIDDKMAALYNERMKLVEEVAKEKGKGGKNVKDASRENKILLRVSEKVDEKYLTYLKKVYGTIFETSKAYQSRIIAKEPTGDIKKALTFSEKPFPVKARVACQGVEGAYSEIAANELIEFADISFFKSFDGVFTAVEKGFSRSGVLPVENSYAGSVNRVYDLMRDHKFYIVKSIKLTISHCLCGIKGAKKSDIKEVMSHEQAISQCRNYLDKSGISVITPQANTAISAKLVAEKGDKSVAAICSVKSAELYGLEIIDENIQDSDNNYTRFILIAKEPELYKDANKISIMTTLPHVSGSLASVLGKFSDIGINLTKLESRPTSSGSFEFMFYFDFECDVTDHALYELLAELQEQGKLIFLGAYGEIIR